MDLIFIMGATSMRRDQCEKTRQNHANFCILWLLINC